MADKGKPQYSGYLHDGSGWYRVYTRDDEAFVARWRQSQIDAGSAFVLLRSDGDGVHVEDAWRVMKPGT